VKVTDYPTHAASKPVALLPNCAATRHAHFVLDGSGPATIEVPSLDDWPRVAFDTSSSRRVNLDTLTKAEVASWKAGERLLLSGKLLTGRDAAHKRMTEMLARGEKLPVDFTNRFIYYVDRWTRCATRPWARGPDHELAHGPLRRAHARADGPDRDGGKERARPAATESIRKHKAVYCIAVGGAAYLVSKAIRKSRVLAFADSAWKRSTSSR